ncbi:MAG: glycosyltransferase family 2 protein [Pseudomonadota bacterium]
MIIEICFYILICLLCIAIINALINLVSAPVIRNNSSNKIHDLVSVLVPMRNEEANIKIILTSIISQDYSNIEIIVLNDCSEDNSLKVAQQMANQYKQIRVIDGQKLPLGWTGKNWACHQLSNNAKGNLFLFLDADCIMAPWVVKSVVNLIYQRNLSLVSCFPTQITNTFGEKLVVPLLNWFLLTLLPLRLVFISSLKSFVAANGQFMFFRKNDYETIGGHEAVKTKIVEDMELARLVKQNRFKMMTLLGGKGVFCRMYQSLDDAIKGFTKNFYPGFSGNAIAFFLFITTISIVFMAPFVLSMVNVKYLLLVFVIFAQRAIISIISGQSLLLAIVLHPLQMIYFEYIALLSIIKSKSGNIKWKGRRIS